MLKKEAKVAEELAERLESQERVITLTLTLTLTLDTHIYIYIQDR